MNYKETVRAAYKQLRKDGVRPKNALLQAKFAAQYDPQTKYGRKFNIMPSRYEAYDGEEITELPNGWKIKVEFQHDSDSGPPWRDCDGMGVVTDWIRSVDEPEREGYWELSSDRHHARYYDWKATLPEAMRDGWDSAPYGTRKGKEKAMAAMKSTYEYLRRWCNDSWRYVGMIVTLLDENDEELSEEACCGFESDNMDYLCEQARSWAAIMIYAERRARRSKTDAWKQYELNLEAA